ncbi:MAG: hypothetical protein AB7P00_37885, partial [Sandaracinaceae bacterium]
MPPPRLTDAQERWKIGALKGDAPTLDALLDEAREADESSWVTTLAYARAMLGGATLAPPPRPRDDDPAAPVIAALRVRAGLLALDVTELAEASRLAARVADREPLLGAASRAWAGLALGEDPRAVRDTALDVQERAKREKHGGLLVDATALEAMTYLADGEADEHAVSRARLGSRMAASEGLAPITVLAHLVLARARRLSGHPYLGSHIARSVAQYLGAGLRRWSDWESVLGAGDASAVEEGSSCALVGLLRAFEACDRAALGDRRAELEVTELPRFARRDADVLLELADHLAPAVHAAGWLDGTDDAVPAGLGVGPGHAYPGYVVARPGGVARRVLAVGVALARAELDAVVVQPPTPQHRTDSAIAALLLHGDAGVDVSVLFERLYGFPLAARHRSVLRVLLHRVRARVGELELERDADRVRLRYEAAVLFPDPRCSRSDASVLALAAQRGAISTRDLEGMGMPDRKST